MREQPVNHQGVERNDDCGCEDGNDAQLVHIDPFVHGIRIMQGIVVQGELLIEGRYLINKVKDHNEDATMVVRYQETLELCAASTLTR